MIVVKLRRSDFVSIFEQLGSDAVIEDLNLVRKHSGEQSWYAFMTFLSVPNFYYWKSIVKALLKKFNYFWIIRNNRNFYQASKAYDTSSTKHSCIFWLQLKCFIIVEKADIFDVI